MNALYLENLKSTSTNCLEWISLFMRCLTLKELKTEVPYTKWVTKMKSTRLFHQKTQVKESIKVMKKTVKMLGNI